MKSSRWKSLQWSALLTALAVAVLGALPHGMKLKVAGPLVNSSYDWLFAFRGSVPVTNAVIIFMDEESHQRLEQPLNAPWDRNVHARLIERLTRAGAKAVVMDIVFSDPNPANPAADQGLARAIKENGRVVLAADPKEGPADAPDFIPPIDLFRDAAGDRWGLVQMAPFYDQVIRTHPPSFSPEKVSLGWQTARLLAAPVTKLSNQEPVLRWMNYYGPARHIPNCSYWEGLDAQSLPDSFFRDRAVFIGASTLTKFTGDRKDAFVTPFSRWVHDPRQLFIAGVEVQATAAINLVRGDWLTRTSSRVELAVLIVVGLVVGYGLSRLRPLLATFVAGAAAIGIGVASYYLFTRSRVFFPWHLVEIQVIAAWLCSITLNSIQLFVQKRLLEQSLSMYLSPKLVKKFAANTDRRLHKRGAEKQTLTILFSDIEKFSSISEGMDSDDLAQMMNEYFQSAVGNCIHATDGTVVKYIGDSIFAFWNAPEPQVDHAARACEAALLFREQNRRRFHGRQLLTRIGLHTGVANVGNFGSETRVDYTAIGEAINLASRMEGLNKFLGTEVLITGETKKEIGDAFVTRYLGRFQLKGFERSVDVHELLGRKGEVRTEIRDEFDSALRLFQQRDLQAAENAFQRVLEVQPDDGATKFYTRHIAEVRHEGMPETWNGEVELKEK